jgi:nucleobase:cation symporter-1, NCS1 family
MSAGEEVILHSNEVFEIEVRGFDHIPDPERNMTLRHADWLWVATSVNLFSFALGAIAITLGLNLWQAFAACALGSAAYIYLALGSIATVRAGMPVSTVARAAFGMRGNWPNALLAWVSSISFEVINTIFGVDALLALFQVLGWNDSGAAGKSVAVLLQLFLCGGIAVLGHATMVWFQRIFAALVSVALVVVIFYTIGRVDWAHGAAVHAQRSSTTILAAFVTATAILASNPLSFLSNGPDWVRYLPSATSARSIFHHVFWTSYLPSLVLTLMGAYCATLGDMTDPVAGLKPFMPAWMFVIYIIAVVGGSLANNVPTYYSSGLSIQALGIKLHRYAATMLDVIVSTAVTLYIVFVQDFSTALNDFIALLVVWVGPFGGVWICDAYLRRGQYDARAMHSKARSLGAYWGWHGLNIPGCIALLAGMLIAAMTMESPLYNGPIATALGGADLSWMLGLPVSALVYAALTLLFQHRRGRLPEASRSNDTEEDSPVFD